MTLHCAECNAEWDAIMPLPMPLKRAALVMKGIAAAGCPSCHAYGKNVLCGSAPTTKPDFKAKAAGIEDQLAKITAQLESATKQDRPRLIALAASLRRSLRWYTSRTGTRSDVHA